MVANQHNLTSSSLFNIMLPESVALIGWRGEVPVLRPEFLARVRSWQATLAPLSGRQFALYLDDSIEFAAALFGAWHAGKTIWLSADTLPASVAVLKNRVDGFIGSFGAECQPVEINLASESAQPLVSLTADFSALVVHTSGSTGTVQAILKKLSQLTSEVATLEHLFGAQLGDAEIISTVSHQHIYGLLFKVLWPLAAGRALHAGTIQYPEQLALHLKNSALISSPAHLKRLPEVIDWPAGKALFCSGGLLSADAALNCAAKLGYMPIEVYGSSETGGIAWRQRSSHNDDGWRAMPGVEWRCSGEDGLIEVRSAHLSDPGWLTLPDRITPLPDGRFSLMGRTDRIIKIEEKRISLDALEHRLNQSGLVAESRLIVLDDQNGGRLNLAAVLVLTGPGQQMLETDGKLALVRQLKIWLKESVEAVALPRRWRCITQMPVNAQGKTPRAMLHALFDDAAQHAAAPPLPVEPLYTIMQCTAVHAELDVQWLRQLAYFEGHFDDAPVLAGIVQVDWAIKIARQLFELQGAFIGMRGLKFQQVVFPDDVTRLTLNYDVKKASLKFSYFAPDKQYSSGRILFEPGVTSA